MTEEQKKLKTAETRLKELRHQQQLLVDAKNAFIRFLATDPKDRNNLYIIAFMATRIKAISKQIQAETVRRSQGRLQRAGQSDRRSGLSPSRSREPVQFG